MLKGFWKLTWIEIKIFIREPLGVIGSLGLPVVIFVVLGRVFGSGRGGPNPLREAPFNVPILTALIIAVGAVFSLVAVITIYREGGILKRLRATPLSPITILSVHVFVKLAFTIAALALLVLAGRRFLPNAIDVNMPSFTAALLLSTLSVLSLGFVIASIVPTARFAQPIGVALLYPMIAVSGLFFPLSQLPVPVRVVAYALPTTHSVSLMQSIWDGAGWSAALVNVVALVIIFVVCVGISTRVFRWE